MGFYNKYPTFRKKVTKIYDKVHRGKTFDHCSLGFDTLRTQPKPFRSTQPAFAYLKLVRMGTNNPPPPTQAKKVAYPHFSVGLVLRWTLTYICEKGSTLLGFLNFSNVIFNDNLLTVMVS